MLGLLLMAAPVRTRAASPAEPPQPGRRPSPDGARATRASHNTSRTFFRGGDCLAIGVLDGELLHALGRPAVPHGLGPASHLGDCADLARAHQLRQLWLTPAALEALELPASYGRRDTLAASFLAHPGLVAPASQLSLAPRLSVWGGPGDAAVEVLVPSWERRRSPWSPLAYAPALLAEVVDFTDATGMMWKGSGAITSDAWLRDHYGRKLEPMDWPPPALDSSLEPSLYVSRPPLEEERRARYVMAFDVNGMFLSAASSLALPVGPYQHISGVYADPSRPGYWWDASRGWITTPTGAALAGAGDSCPLWPEAYFWPESHRWLEPWYRALRDGRTRLLETGSVVALEALKAVYREGVGRFGSVSRTKEADPLFVPYWRHAVQAEARTRLERHIRALPQSPVAVDIDSLFFLTSRSSPARFARALGLRLGDGLGAFRFAGIAPGRAAREILEDPTARDPVKLLRELVKKGAPSADA